MTLKEKIAVMEAFDEGKSIQIKVNTRDTWEDCIYPAWNWSLNEYRIKGEQIYCPYNNAEEIFADVIKHNGWIKDSEGLYHISKVLNTGKVETDTVILTPEVLFACYKWADDNSPCGILKL